MMMLFQWEVLLTDLIEQGHEVHVAYQTSGNIAVSNEEALKFAEVSMALNSKSTESERYY